MSEVTPRAANGRQRQPSRRLRLWLWFVAGFLLAFIGLSVTLSMYFYDGHVIYRTKVWHYYLLEIRRAWNSTGQLGPTSGSSSAALTVALQHILLSLVGGAVMLGIGWVVKKRSRPT
jgi:hypothetical protein